jgi:hypothetical protein
MKHLASQNFYQKVTQFHEITKYITINITLKHSTKI